MSDHSVNKMLLSLSSLVFCHSAIATNFLFEPSPYFSERDSPFYQGIIDNSGNGIFLEDFEDQALNTPFVRQLEGRGFIGSTTRSRNPNAVDGRIIGVDGDDGEIDGNTFGGDTWSSIGTAGGGVSPRSAFEFQPDNQGRYPRYVGIVVTDISDFDEDVETRFIDPNGNVAVQDSDFNPLDWAPPEGATGSDPRLHRFIGAFSENGIRTLSLFNADQVDHLQYGYSIPEPSGASLLLLSGLLAAGARRRRLVLINS